MGKRFSKEDQQTIWDMREAGVPVKRIAKHLERQNVSIRKFIADHGAQRPTPRQRSELRLSLEEREEISRGLAAGFSVRTIAEGLERSPSTVFREVNANGGRTKYRALHADRGAERRALRPKRAKLSQCRRLRTTVERKLEARWSPQQISAWLAETYPDDPEMQVSHETIYQSLFVQSRGALRRELHPCLRTGRAMRRAKAYTKGGVGQGRLTNMVMISERPARGDRSSGPRPLGRRPHLRAEDDLHRHPGQALQPLRHPLEVAQRSRGRGGAKGHDQTHPDSAGPAPSIYYVGSGQGDGRARPVHRRHWCADLLLRSEEPVAKGKQREHQRTPSSVLTEVVRSLPMHPAGTGRHRKIPQHPPSTDARLDDTIKGVRRSRCVDRLRSQHLRDSSGSQRRPAR